MVVLIIFPVILQTIINLRMLSIGGQRSYRSVGQQPEKSDRRRLSTTNETIVVVVVVVPVVVRATPPPVVVPPACCAVCRHSTGCQSRLPCQSMQRATPRQPANLRENTRLTITGSVLNNLPLRIEIPMHIHKTQLILKPHSQKNPT